MYFSGTVVVIVQPNAEVTHTYTTRNTKHEHNVTFLQTLDMVVYIIATIIVFKKEKKRAEK